ncbi:hypothetical protein [Treponema primitia]|uniref:hypothetical protein n=1 Tax=Treponema primitia TaxID=88058 RepID=UPI0002FDBF0E|nr:hypothetical protein [Treponema primitia]
MVFFIIDKTARNYDLIAGSRGTFSLSRPRYGDLCGITQEELKRDFAPEIGQII